MGLVSALEVVAPVFAAPVAAADVALHERAGRMARGYDLDCDFEREWLQSG